MSFIATVSYELSKDTTDDARRLFRAELVGRRYFDRWEGKRMPDTTVWARKTAAEGEASDLKRRFASVQQELNALEHTGDHERFARLNDEWHRLIIEGSGNSYIAMFVERLRVPIYRLLFSTFYSAQRIDRANAGHRRISEAILAGRGKEAERLMREHIEEGLEALESIEIE